MLVERARNTGLFPLFALFGNHSLRTALPVKLASQQRDNGLSARPTNRPSVRIDAGRQGNQSPMPASFQTDRAIAAYTSRRAITASGVPNWCGCPT